LLAAAQVGHHVHQVQAAAARVGIDQARHLHCQLHSQLQLAQVARQAVQVLDLTGQIQFLARSHQTGAGTVVGAQLAGHLLVGLQQAVQAAAVMSTAYLQAQQETHLLHLRHKATTVATVKAVPLIVAAVAVAPAQLVQQEQLAQVAQVRRHQ
jgi:hypothetical protein